MKTLDVIVLALQYYAAKDIKVSTEMQGANESLKFTLYGTEYTLEAIEGSHREGASFRSIEKELE